MRVELNLRHRVWPDGVDLLTVFRNVKDAQKLPESSGNGRMCSIGITHTDAKSGSLDILRTGRRGNRYRPIIYVLRLKRRLLGSIRTTIIAKSSRILLLRMFGISQK